MATITFDGIDEYAKKLSVLGKDAKGICKFACYEAAGIVCDAIKANTPSNTGDLKESVSLSKFADDEGFIYTQVIFPGYDRKGTPNVIKARVLEHGRSDAPKGLYKHPFIRPAVNRVKSAAEFSIEKELDKKINEIMKG